MLQSSRPLTQKGENMKVDCQFPKITLPNCPTLVARLRAKLAEYEGRNPYTSPECDQDNFFKKEILKRLIEAGQVTQEWCESRFSDLPRDIYHTYYLANALCVINAYCLLDFVSIKDGTGLPSPA
ncbi:MAG: hypothetical protein CL685_03230 [Candidatus Magasanikbacteria bacterium]|nr:hypothetical protein [Candidatus Magasanikbacteria bacterium]|tara:strand:+ start:1985 stop:2359 length:375 start_codon:yes stop_codon:yes gene_type:complete